MFKDILAIWYWPVGRIVYTFLQRVQGALGHERIPGGGNLHNQTLTETIQFFNRIALQLLSRS